MKIAINIALLLLAAFLVFLLVKSIEEPIRFQEVSETRKAAVIERLQQNRDAQLAFRSIKKGYAPNYDTLKQVIMNDSFEIVSIFGDPETEGDFQRIVTKKSAKDSIVDALGINLDSIQFIPYSNGAKFEITADTTSFQKTSIPVITVKAPIKSFMQEFTSSDEVIERYQRYDPNFDSDAVFMFGSMSKPSTAGNWE